MGLACARRLAGEGAQIWILGSSRETVEAARSDDFAGAAVCDVSDESSVVAAVAEAVEALGGLDAAFVNAGIDGMGASVLDLPVDNFRRVLDVNVIGAFLVAREAARYMEAGSAIVVNASVNAMQPEQNFVDYNSSKAAAVSLAQSMTLDLADRQIAVTAVCPGYVRTRMTAPYLDDPEQSGRLLAEIPAGRFGEPNDVAALVSFLVSPEAGYMTGSVITIDGGRSI